jgi:hypothetical protein
MTAPASGRISAAKTGWIIVLLMVGWALFLFLPFGREEKVESPKTQVDNPGEAELAAVGLAYNVDWIGLPQYFAVWADRIEWVGDEAQFAYWNPGSRSYSYIIRAIRHGKNYRFRYITTDPTFNPASESVPESDTHPFLFSVEKVVPPLEPVRSLPGLAPAHPAAETPQADVDLTPSRLEPPKKLEQDESINGKKP